MASLRIVALCGQKRVGKDTVAQYLCDTHNFTHMKLAKRLKNCVSIMFDMTPEQVEFEKKDVIDARWGVSPRRILQWMGTDVMQFEVDKLIPGLDRRFWVDRTIDDIENHRRSTTHDDVRIVISDVRFLHEIDALRRRFNDDVMVVKLSRTHGDARVASREMHLSELEVHDVTSDVNVANDGHEVTDLYRSIDRVVLRWLSTSARRLDGG